MKLINSMERIGELSPNGSNVVRTNDSQGPVGPLQLDKVYEANPKKRQMNMSLSEIFKDV